MAKPSKKTPSKNAPAPTSPEAYKRTLAKKGYREVERGAILKWAELGQGYEVTGTMLRLEKGKFDKPLLKLRNSETGKVETYGCPTILASKLEGIVEGQEIVIVCTGQTEVEGQLNPAWAFDVFVKEGSGDE